MSKYFIFVLLFWLSGADSMAGVPRCAEVYLNDRTTVDWWQSVADKNPENSPEIQKINSQLFSNLQQLQAFKKQVETSPIPEDKKSLIAKAIDKAADQTQAIRSMGKWLIDNDSPTSESISYLYYFSKVQNDFNNIRTYLSSVGSEQESLVVNLTRIAKQILLRPEMKSVQDLFGVGLKGKFGDLADVEILFDQNARDRLQEQINRQYQSEEERQQVYEAYLHRAQNRYSFLTYIRNEQQNALSITRKASVYLSPKAVTLAPKMGPYKIKIIPNHAGEAALLKVRHNNEVIVGYAPTGRISYDGNKDQESELFSLHDLAHNHVIYREDLELFSSLDLTQREEIQSLQTAAANILDQRIRELEQNPSARQRAVVEFTLNFMLYETGGFYPTASIPHPESLLKIIKGSAYQRWFDHDRLIFGKEISTFTLQELSDATQLVRRWVEADKKTFFDMVKSSVPALSAKLLEQRLWRSPPF